VEHGDARRLGEQTTVAALPGSSAVVESCGLGADSKAGDPEEARTCGCDLVVCRVCLTGEVLPVYGPVLRIATAGGVVNRGNHRGQSIPAAASQGDRRTPRPGPPCGSVPRTEKDLRGLPLTRRKRALTRLVPATTTVLSQVFSIEERGRDMFAAAERLRPRGDRGQAEGRSISARDGVVQDQEPDLYPG
jgi:hypothetical protein